MPILIRLVRAAIAAAVSSTDGHSPSSFEVMLDEPGGVEAQFLGQFNLLEHLAIDLGVRLPGAVGHL